MTPQRPHADEADYVVIGSGAAGALVACRLARAGREVVLLEEGPPVDRTRAGASLYESFTHLCRDAGTQVATGRGMIPMLQGRCVGGSTAINSAICWRMPEDVYDRCWRQSGLADAVPEAALHEAWDTIETELGIHPVEPSRMGRNNALMAEACAKLGYQGRVIPRNERGCIGSASCLQACPSRVKQSTDVTYVPWAVAAGARLYTSCRAEVLWPRVPARGEPASVRARFVDEPGLPVPRSGRIFRVRARRGVVVAASALQSPALLQRSRLGGRLAGQRLQAHPGTGLVGVFDAPVRMWEGATQGYECDHFRKDGRFKLETIALQPELGGVRLPGVGERFVKWLSRYGHLAIWGAQTRAAAFGTVRPGLTALGGGSVRIRYAPGSADMDVLRRALRVMAEMMFAAGARAVLPGVHGLPEELTDVKDAAVFERASTDPRDYKIIATHLFGTCVMGDDPASSVVARDFQVHGAPGVYVVDSSVFPTNLGVNPQHSIMAVAELASRKLLGD